MGAQPKRRFRGPRLFPCVGDLTAAKEQVRGEAVRFTYVSHVPHNVCCCTMLAAKGLAGICMMLATVNLAYQQPARALASLRSF